MSITRRTVLAAGVAIVVAGPMLGRVAWAAPMKMTVPMVASDEVPPNDSKGTGSVALTYDPSNKELSWVVTWTGLTGPATAAHFHGPAAPGTNAPVVIPIGAAGMTSPTAGSKTLTDPQAADFMAGKWYVNVHSAAHPAGEIRGQITPSK